MRPSQSSAAEETNGPQWRRVWRRVVRGGSGTSDDGPRIDEPPYEIAESDSLCENMPSGPSLSFVQWDVAGGVLEDEGLPDPFVPHAKREFYAAVLTDEADLERIGRPVEMINDEGEPENLIEETDFASEAVLVIETGYRTRGIGGNLVSSSITPQVNRIETTDDGIRAFGCYRTRSRFNEGTTETTVVRFERPESLESAVVSLTISDENRITFSNDDGVVTVEGGELVDDDRYPWIDGPTHRTAEPSCDDGERDRFWLCGIMPAEPSLAFEQEATSRRVLRDEGVAPIPEIELEGERSQYYATLLTDRTDLERVDRERGGPAAELLAETDFSSEAALVVQTGWGSSSTPPHLERIEPTDDGIRAYGCHADPCFRTDDITIRTVVARFERPDALEWGAVSLTTGPERRVNFATHNGVVTVVDGEIA